MPVTNLLACERRYRHGPLDFIFVDSGQANAVQVGQHQHTIRFEAFRLNDHCHSPKLRLRFLSVDDGDSAVHDYVATADLVSVYQDVEVLCYTLLGGLARFFQTLPACHQAGGQLWSDLLAEVAGRLIAGVTPHTHARYLRFVDDVRYYLTIRDKYRWQTLNNLNDNPVISSYWQAEDRLPDVHDFGPLWRALPSVSWHHVGQQRREEYQGRVTWDTAASQITDRTEIFGFPVRVEPLEPLGQPDANAKAKQLFLESFPSLEKSGRLTIPSQSIAGVLYRISTHQIDQVYVYVDDRNISIGYLCLEVRNAKGDVELPPVYDRLLQRALLLKYDEKRFWREAYFHGQENDLVVKMGGRYYRHQIEIAQYRNDDLRPTFTTEELAEMDEAARQEENAGIDRINRYLQDSIARQFGLAADELALRGLSNA